MPGSGKYSGAKYRGSLRPSYDLDAKSIQALSDERLQEISDALNDAYDFDAVDARDFRNADIVAAEEQRRAAAKVKA